VRDNNLNLVPHSRGSLQAKFEFCGTTWYKLYLLSLNVSKTLIDSYLRKSINLTCPSEFILLFGQVRPIKPGTNLWPIGRPLS